MSEECAYYFRDSPTTKIDVYRVLTLYNVTHPALQHAIKKLLVAGGRGAKDAAQDVHEAIGALQRWQQMHREEQAAHVNGELIGPDEVARRAFGETGKSTT